MRNDSFELLPQLHVRSPTLIFQSVPNPNSPYKQDRHKLAEVACRDLIYVYL